MVTISLKKDKQSS